MGKADILLRLPGLEIGENDNKNIQIFPDDIWIRSQPANNRQTSPPNPQECEQILATHHNNPLAGHPGIRKTFDLVQREYHWPDMQKDVERYVKGCEVCQCTKPNQKKCAAPLHPHNTC